MKKQLLFLALLSSLVISGCNQSKTSSSESSNSSTESTLTSSITSEETTTSGQGTTSSSGSSTSSTPSSSSNPSSTSTPSSSSSSSSTSSGPVLPPPPVIFGSDIEEALKKISSLTEGEESGIEYYVGNHDFVAVLNSNVAVMMGYQYAWDFYCYYNNESYAYWDEQMHMQTTGWISKGSKGTKVGIDKAYFYMPYFLSVITEDDVEGVLGSYVVKESSLDKVLGGLGFLWSNDISYIDFFIDEEGYISRIRGFDDPNDDSLGFVIKLSEFGTTKTPDSVTLPPEISESTIKTYADMLGHEEEPDIYIESMSININETVESDDTHQIVMYPDDSVDISYYIHIYLLMRIRKMSTGTLLMKTWWN